MAQISDVMRASAVFDAARQELAWAYSGDFSDVPEPMKDAVHAISAVLNEAEMRWVTSSREGEEEQEPMVVAGKENAMAVVAATGGGGEKKKKREDAGVVKEADTRSVEQAETQIKVWLERLEKVACDMRAVAQMILLGDKSKIDEKLNARWLPCLPGTSRIAPDTGPVARELQALKEQYDKQFGCSTGLPLAATRTEQAAACGSAAAAAAGHGDVYQDVMQRIIEDINSDTTYRLLLIRRKTVATILPIVGPPCFGKAILAKLFHREFSSKNYYKVWVDMVRVRDMKEIHEPIIELLGRDCFAAGHIVAEQVKTEKDRGSLIDQLLKQRKGTELLLCLDNLQVELGCSDEERKQRLSMLEQLRWFLEWFGSRVVAIVTTPSEASAKYISRWCTVKPHRLHPWSRGDGMCRDMKGRHFLQGVDPQEWTGLTRGRFSSDSQQLRPLPIHSVFTLLKSSSIHVGAEPWLSLAYCAFFVFPKSKGHGVAMCDLLNQWCSLGITTRQRGASCIWRLLNYSLILGEEPAWGKDPDEAPNASMEAATLLTMEDLMHDFARYLLGDRLIVVDGRNGATPSTSSPVNNKSSSSAYLALVSNFDVKQLDISSILPAGILALRFEGCGEMQLSDSAFASFAKCLRLLDLSGYSEKKMLPDFIRHLKQLRYLKAPEIQDRVLPRSIIGLYELRYLILHRSCQLSHLTEAFERLHNLLHLDLSGCTGLKALPDSFGRLWRLEHLDLSACSGTEALPESFCLLRNLKHLDLSRCSGLKALPESFGKLTSLWHLDLSRCSGLKALPESFGELTSLRHLDLSHCSGLEELPTSSFKHLTELRHLDLSGFSMLQALPKVSLPRKLRHLNLSGCSELQGKDLPDVPIELRHLDLSGCPSLSTLPKSYLYPRRLVHLNLSGCSGLLELDSIQIQYFDCLEHLDLSNCSQLEDPPISHLRRLQYLDLSGCSQINSRKVSGLSDLVESIRRRGGRAKPAC